LKSGLGETNDKWRSDSFERNLWLIDGLNTALHNLSNAGCEKGGSCINVSFAFLL